MSVEQFVPDPRPKCESCGRPIGDYEWDAWGKRRFGKTVYVANDGTVAHVRCPAPPDDSVGRAEGSGLHRAERDGVSLTDQPTRTGTRL